MRGARGIAPAALPANGGFLALPIGVGSRG